MGPTTTFRSFAVNPITIEDEEEPRYWLHWLKRTKKVAVYVTDAVSKKQERVCPG